MKFEWGAEREAEREAEGEAEGEGKVDDDASMNSNSGVTHAA